MKKTNNKNEIKLQKKGKRLRLLIAVFIIALLGLVIRLFWIQFIDGSKLREMAYKQITASSIIKAKRGTIFDSTGKTLASSVPVDTISINPDLIVVKNDETKTKELKEKVAKGLSENLGLDYEKVLAQVTSIRSLETIAQKVENDKVTNLKEWMKENDIYSGINIDEDSKRYYPYDNLASNLIGFCGSDNNGLAGIEYNWDSVLSGTAGRSISSIDATQDSIPDKTSQYVAPKDGSNITLSIDANIQSIAEKYLKEAVEENECKNGGTVILMDPTTGNILAMASYPDYNLNKPFEPNEVLAQTWAELSDDEKTDSLYRMYRNRIVSDTYEPGSVFKIILASAALEENISETDTEGEFYCGGSQEVGDVEIYCADSDGHGSQSLRNALENSCNPALIQLGQKIGATKLYKYINAFGFLNQTGIATSGESSSSFHDLEDVGPTELATISFGQRFTITPIQMITAACAVVNGGNLIQPKIVTKIEDTNTGAIHNIETTTVRQVISKETSDKMRDIMHSVVTDGGGSQGAVEGYSIGGKTGTSEPDPNHPENGYVASFLAIAPVENTKVVALMSLYNPQGTNGHYGGRIAAPAISKILTEVLPYLGIPADGNVEFSSSYTSSYITVPNLKGKTVKEAQKQLESMGLKCSTNSNLNEIVTLQIPDPDSGILRNGIVTLYSENNSTIISTPVPNLIGKSLSEAQNILNSKNLNIQFSGSGNVVSQEPEPETSVEEGRIVKVYLE